MTTGPVGLYLAATRLGHTFVPVEGEIVAYYRAVLNKSTFALSLSGHERCPELVLADTADAKVENVVTADRDIVVYDLALRRELLALTGFVRRSAPAAEAIAWGLRRLSVTLVGLGAAWPAMCAHHLAERAVAALPAGQGPRPSDSVRRSVEVQEHFVLAHESVHSALRHGTLDPGMVRAATDLVGDAVQAAESTRTAPVTQDVVAAVVQDEIDAINAGSELFHISEAERRLLVKRRRREYPLRAYVGSWVDERPHLIEELVCDFLATDLTLACFASSALTPQEVLEAILLGFHNHGATQSIRELARRIAGAPSPDLPVVLASRTTAWRTAAPDVWGHHGTLGPECMRAGFAEVTDAASRAVGNQIRYTLWADFNARLARTGDPPNLPLEHVAERPSRPRRPPARQGHGTGHRTGARRPRGTRNPAVGLTGPARVPSAADRPSTCGPSGRGGSAHPRPSAIAGLLGLPKAVAIRDHCQGVVGGQGSPLHARPASTSACRPDDPARITPRSA